PESLPRSPVTDVSSCVVVDSSESSRPGWAGWTVTSARMTARTATVAGFLERRRCMSMRVLREARPLPTARPRWGSPKAQGTQGFRAEGRRRRQDRAPDRRVALRDSRSLFGHGAGPPTRVAAGLGGPCPGPGQRLSRGWPPRSGRDGASPPLGMRRAAPFELRHLVGDEAVDLLLQPGEHLVVAEAAERVGAALQVDVGRGAPQAQVGVV